MLKKITALIAALMLICVPALAEGALVMSGNAIIDGDTVYYSGSIDSVETGVYRMTSTGTGVSRLYDSVMTLLEADNGNVLAVSFDEPDSEYALVVLNALGEKTIVSEDYVDHAIAADGRFYWGVGSCNTDGSDVCTLIDDKEHSYNYYPLTVQDGMYYYLDWAEDSESVFFEGTGEPVGARLCRMELKSGAVTELASYGASYLGIEDGYIYYTRNPYWLYDSETGETYEVSVNGGVYRTNLETLVTDRLVEFPDDESVSLDYSLMVDGVIYGVSTYYSEESVNSEIVRMKTDGTALSSISLDNQAPTLHGVSDGVLYASLCSIEYSGDDYVQRDLLYGIHLDDGTVSLISTPASDLFYFTESLPDIGVAGDRIYMIVDDMDACAISLKSCALDGSDWQTLARGESLAAG
jgi:hypothetical protein